VIVGSRLLPAGDPTYLGALKRAAGTAGSDRLEHFLVALAPNDQSVKAEAQGILEQVGRGMGDMPGRRCGNRSAACERLG
jgi:hypothetical protein